MPSPQRPDNLELVLADPALPAPGRTLVVPQLPGSGTGRLVSALFEAAPGRRRLLPAPSPNAPTAQLRTWYRDAWLALGEEVREWLLVATGPTAAHLAPALGDRALTVAFVREPVAALAACDPAGVPIKRIRSSLAGGESREPLRPWSNPQSRGLLEPWHDTDALAVTSGPPTDADHWRGLLFDDILPRVEVTADAERFARRIAVMLRSARKRAVRLAAALDENGPALAPDPSHDELLRSMNWLDVELYDRVTG